MSDVAGKLDQLAQACIDPRRERDLRTAAATIRQQAAEIERLRKEQGKLDKQGREARHTIRQQQQTIERLTEALERILANHYKEGWFEPAIIASAALVKDAPNQTLTD